MKNQLNLYEAKTHLSEVIQQVCETGEPYTVCKNNKPVVDIVVHRKSEKKKKLPDSLPEYDGKVVYLCDPLGSTGSLSPRRRCAR